ncbi:MAG: thiamine pyrophosphate-dependent enzyme [Patescibacteria group bacterium]
MTPKSLPTFEDLSLKDYRPLQEYPKDELLERFRIAYTYRLFDEMLQAAWQKQGRLRIILSSQGKEMLHLCHAAILRPGDFDVGYYRELSFMYFLHALGKGGLSLEECGAQALSDPFNDISGSGRHMPGHVGSKWRNPHGGLVDMGNQVNVFAGESPIAAQIGPAVGMADASLHWQRILGQLSTPFHTKGEIIHVKIGDSGCAKGQFLEGVMASLVAENRPLVFTVMNDGWGIGAHSDEQIPGGEVAPLVAGIMEAHQCRATNWAQMKATYGQVFNNVRDGKSGPVLIEAFTSQPAGHSTTSDPRRIKTPQELLLEKENDGLPAFEKQLIELGIATPAEIDAVKAAAKEAVEAAKNNSWNAYAEPIQAEARAAIAAIEALKDVMEDFGTVFQPIMELLRNTLTSTANELKRKNVDSALQEAARYSAGSNHQSALDLRSLARRYHVRLKNVMVSNLNDETPTSLLHLPAVPIQEGVEKVSGAAIMRDCFDYHLTNNPLVVLTGQDVENLGGYYLEVQGLAKKHGAERVSESGIRESTTAGRVMGMAARGLRPIVVGGYINYLPDQLDQFYNQIGCYRDLTDGRQIAPVTFVLNGDRLDGPFHASSLAGILTNLRGFCVVYARNQVQASGAITASLKGNDPVIIVSPMKLMRGGNHNVVLNNGEFTIPIGDSEVIREGRHVTIVTLGYCCTVAQEAAQVLSDKYGIEVEIVDAQTLLPVVDKNGAARKSCLKTRHVIFLSEDVPHGVSAYLASNILENCDEPIKRRHLDATANMTRTGIDGDHWSKPQVEDVIRAVLALRHDLVRL